ncbi:hypothetical protein EPN81_01645 [Patescibacteria group bacterium]|nr:MAG: hypothetical protein EPN81_01645 [Patescibacteria group bacterium]
MPTLRLVRADEPSQARESVDLRRMLERLTYGTHKRGRGFLFLPPEAQALFDVLGSGVFSPAQLDRVEMVIRSVDPHEIGSEWDDHRLESFVSCLKRHVERPEWINLSLDRLHAAMRSQGPDARFRLWYMRAVLVAFLTVDFLSSDPEEINRLAG